MILKTLKRFGGNKTEAAKALGITRKTLHAKLSKYQSAQEGMPEGEGENFMFLPALFALGTEDEQ